MWRKINKNFDIAFTGKCVDCYVRDGITRMRVTGRMKVHYLPFYNSSSYASTWEV